MHRMKLFYLVCLVGLLNAQDAGTNSTTENNTDEPAANSNGNTLDSDDVSADVGKAAEEALQ